MSYQTYIFDLDGTLLDTLGDLAASVNYAMRMHGMPEHSVDEVRLFVGNGVRRLMEFGLCGIEAFYSGFSKKLRDTALSLAEENGL